MPEIRQHNIPMLVGCTDAYHMRHLASPRSLVIQQSFGVFSAVGLNKLLNKHSSCQWYEMLQCSCDMCYQCVMISVPRIYHILYLHRRKIRCIPLWVHVFNLLYPIVCHVVIWVNIGSGNGLLPDGTKPLPEPMLTYHQCGSLALTWVKFHM